MANPYFIPEFSTNSIWWNRDTSKCLTDHITEMQTSIDEKAAVSHTHSGYAITEHTHNTMIQSANTQLTAAVSNGSFSVTPDLDLVDNSRYLVNLQYSTSSGLVGRSLYALKVNKSSTLQQTITLSEPKNGTDNLMVVYRNGAFTFTTTYNGASPTNVTINII